MAATWTFGLLDAAGNNVTEAGLPLASQRKLLFQLGAPNLCVFMLPLTSQEARLLLTGQHYVKAWRQQLVPTPSGVYEPVGSKVLRFYGPVWTREIKGALGQMMVSALDPMVYLGRRFTTLAGTGDQGTALKDMIDNTNTVDGETGIRTNAANITASASVTLDLVQQNPAIMSMVQQFAQQLDGCDTWIEPIDLASGKIGDLYVSPRRGVDVSDDVVFGFGDSTHANCSDMGSVENMDLVENDVGGYTDALGYEATDETSVASYRRLKSYVSYTGETSAAALASRTLGRLAQRYSPVAAAEYACVPTSRAPQLFDDFGVGDTVQFDFRRGVEFQVDQRVRSAELTIGDTGVETLTGLDVKGSD